VPIVHPLVKELDHEVSPYTQPWLEKTFGQVNPVLGLLFNLAVIATILFVLSMTLIPILERLFISGSNPASRERGKERGGGTGGCAGQSGEEGSRTLGAGAAVRREN
jgi:hypothetical protein